MEKTRKKKAILHWGNENCSGTDIKMPSVPCHYKQHQYFLTGLARLDATIIKRISKLETPEHKFLSMTKKISQEYSNAKGRDCYAKISFSDYLENNLCSTKYALCERQGDTAKTRALAYLCVFPFELDFLQV